ncbi:MAG: chordopoxvirus fusion protein [bacterium]|nr:chordopoxvirus fusion protein [bacterium]
MELTKELYEAIVTIIEDKVKDIKVTREEFDSLKSVVGELVVAQRKTEERLSELAEAQRKTEERLNILTDRVDKLAEAQRKTELNLNALITKVGDIEDRLSGLSHTVGYHLENSAYVSLPKLLKKDGYEVEGDLIRKYFYIEGEEYQVNIYGWAKKNGEKVLIIGEAKVRPSRKEIKRFLKISDKLKKYHNNPETLLLFVAHDFNPKIEEFLKENNIKYFWSYEFEQIRFPF